jgi:hypothetical protein
VRYCLHTLLWTALALAQSTTTLYTTDLNGHRVAESTFGSTNGDQTQLKQSINGRQVPLQDIVTRVLADEPNRRVTETIIRRYDPTGRLASTDRTVTEEQKRPGGSTINATLYRTDLNGNYQEAERRTIETATQNGATTADVTISRMGLSGSFQPVEKRKIVTTGDPKSSVHEDETIYRPSDSGPFYEAVHNVTDTVMKDGNSTSTKTSYELDFQGKLSLINQQVTTVTKNPDGSEVTATAYYGAAAYGVARTQQPGPPQLKQEDITVRKQVNGTVVETTSTRLPETLADPSRLGPPRVISETVCTGKCDKPIQVQQP